MKKMILLLSLLCHAKIIYPHLLMNNTPFTVRATLYKSSWGTRTGKASNLSPWGEFGISCDYCKGIDIHQAIFTDKDGKDRTFSFPPNTLHITQDGDAVFNFDYTFSDNLSKIIFMALA